MRYCKSSNYGTENRLKNGKYYNSSATQKGGTMN